jgi:WD40 repeat protein
MKELGRIQLLGGLRLQQRDRLITHFRTQNRLLEQESDIERALVYARRAVSLDPWQEEAHRELMRLLTHAGHPAGAIRQYQELEHLLARELGDTPTQATQHLVRQIEAQLAVHKSSSVPEQTLLEYVIEKGTVMPRLTHSLSNNALPVPFLRLCALAGNAVILLTATRYDVHALQTAGDGNQPAPHVVTTLKGHSEAVWSVAFSHNGRSVLTSGPDETAKVWDVQTGQEALTLRGHTKAVTEAVFSPDGKRIATSSRDTTVKVWDAVTGQASQTLTVASHTKEGHTNWVTSVVFSPDGRRLLAGSRDGTAKVWDALTGHTLLTLQGHTKPVVSVAFSSDGKRILTGSEDETAKVWDETGHEVSTLSGHSAMLTSVAFAPDGRHIVTGSWDDTAKVWDSATGQETFTLRGHAKPVTSVAFSPDGKRILTGSKDSTAKVWDAATGRELLTLQGHTNDVTAVAFSRDGRSIVTGSFDGTAKVWDATIIPKH